jgi:hypothetical protein
MVAKANTSFHYSGDFALKVIAILNYSLLNELIFSIVYIHRNFLDCLLIIQIIIEESYNRTCQSLRLPLTKYATLQLIFRNLKCSIPSQNKFAFIKRLKSCNLYLI